MDSCVTVTGGITREALVSSALNQCEAGILHSQRGIMVKSSKGFKAVVVAVLMGLSVLLSACGDMGGDCTGDNWVGHASECAYRAVTGK